MSPTWTEEEHRANSLCGTCRLQIDACICEGPRLRLGSGLEMELVGRDICIKLGSLVVLIERADLPDVRTFFDRVITLQSQQQKQTGRWPTPSASKWIAEQMGTAAWGGSPDTYEILSTEVTRKNGARHQQVLCLAYGKESADSILHALGEADRLKAELARLQETTAKAALENEVRQDTKAELAAACELLRDVQADYERMNTPSVAISTFLAWVKL